MKLTGTVEHHDIGAGVFVLKSDDGAVYALMGADRAMKKPGLRVEVEGQVDEGAMGVAMVGPVFRVKSFRAL